MSPKNLNASNKTHKFLLNQLKDKQTSKIYKKFEKNLKKVDFELKDVGIFVSINFLEKENSSENLNGNIKGKILKSNFKSDFTYNHDLINIENLFFRDKNLSLDHAYACIDGHHDAIACHLSASEW